MRSLGEFFVRKPNGIEQERKEVRQLLNKASKANNQAGKILELEKKYPGAPEEVVAERERKLNQATVYLDGFYRKGNLLNKKLGLPPFEKPPFHREEDD